MPLLERVQTEEEAPQDTLSVGTVLQDRYLIEASQRTTTLPRSYLASDTKLGGRSCLVQEWPAGSGSEGGDAPSPFFVGAEVRARMSLPHFPPVLDLFSHNNKEYLVLGSVADLQPAGGQEAGLSEAEALRWTDQVADALRAVFDLDRPLVPEGLDPSGVGFAPDGSLMLADVGLTATSGADPSSDQKVIREVGGFLFHLLVGRPPAGGDAESPRAANPSVSDEVDDLVARALGRNGEQSYSGLEEFRSDLGRLLADVSGAGQLRGEMATGPKSISPLWTFKSPDEVRSSPAATEGAIYVGSYDGRMYALDPSDGSQLWEYETERGIASSPHLAEDLVLFGSEDTVFYAVGARTGRLEWMCPTGGKVRSSGQLELDHVFFGSDDGGVYNTRSDSGRVVWKTVLGGPVRSSPAVIGDLVVVGCDDGQVYAMNTSSGEIRWRARTAQAVHSSPVRYQNLVIVGSGDRSVYALDLETGRERWRFRTGGSVVSTAALNEDVAFVGSYDGKLYALDAETGRERWNFEADGPISSSPRFYDGAVYFGGIDGSVYSLSAESGELRWRFNTGGPVPGSPAVHDGVVYIGSIDGKLYALPA